MKPDKNSRNVEETILPLEKEPLNELRQLLQKRNTKLLNDSNFSKFVTKNWIRVNYLPGGQDNKGKTHMLR